MKAGLSAIIAIMLMLAPPAPAAQPQDVTKAAQPQDVTKSAQPQGVIKSAPQPPDAIKLVAHDILQTLIDTNTVHDKGTLTLAEALATRLHSAGYATDDLTLLAPADHPTQANLVVRLHGAGKGKPLLYIGHLDVVDANPADWSLDPFQLTARDGYFYGRGTSDMKGDDAALVTSLIRLKGEGFVPDRDVIVAFTADEEGGDSNGVNWLLQTHRTLIDAGLALNPDGGGGVSLAGQKLYIGLQTSEKIFLTFGLEVTNKGGHSSLPEPDNAIYRLAAGLGRIARLSFPIEVNDTTRAYFAAEARLQQGQLQQDMLAMTHPRPDPAAIRRLSQSPFYNAYLHTTCVATQIEGGHAENALPQRARAVIQCRLMPGDRPDAVQAALVKALDDPKVTLSIITPAMMAPETRPVPAVIAKVRSVVDQFWPGLPIIPIMDAGASDSVYLRAAGIPSFCLTGLFTPMDDNRMHGRDERIGIDNFYENVEFTTRLIKAFAAAE